MSLRIQGDKIEFHNQIKLLWSIPLDQLKLIGEYTTDEGPFKDDYFFVFGLNESTVYQVSNTQIEDPLLFWNKLNSKLGTFEMGPGLSGSTTWISQIIFPQELKSEKLFETTVEYTRQSTLQRLFGIKSSTTKLELTDIAKQQLIK